MSPRQRKPEGQAPGEEIPEGALWGGPRGAVVVSDRREPLTPGQQDELARARSGKREWVGPAVAAYVLGISMETLGQRRRGRVAGVLPEYEKARANRQGTRYRWKSVERCANPGLDDELVKQTRRVEDLTRRVEILERLLAAGGAGLQALATDRAWAVDDNQRVLGLAVLNPDRPWRPMAWREALLETWDHEASRQPYHEAAMALLERVQVACAATER